MNREQANKLLAKLVSEAEDALSAAERFATEHDLEFNFEPAYGMGGTFYGKCPEDISRYHGYNEGDSIWLPSSQTC